MLRGPIRFAFALLLPLALARGGSAGTLDADVVFASNPAQLGIQMTIAFDGTNYWSVSGGGPDLVREAQYDAAGNFVATYSPGLDFRSDFTDSAGNLYARSYADPTIYKQTSPGVFAPYVTLAGGALDVQSSVVLNGAGTEYIAFSAGTLSRWDLAGNALSAVTFSGYGSMGTEGDYPENRAVAAVGDTYLTYSDGLLSVWDLSGDRIDTYTLNSAGQNFNSYFSFSYANNRVWVVDDLHGDWRGYVYPSSTNAVPEPSSLALAFIGGIAALGGVGRRAIRRRRAD